MTDSKLIKFPSSSGLLSRNKIRERKGSHMFPSAVGRRKSFEPQVIVRDLVSVMCQYKPARDDFS